VKILLIGMNHTTAPVEHRERFAAGDPQPALRKLVDDAEIDEAVLVSTCNRVDLVVVTRHLEEARHRIRRFFVQDLAAGDPGAAVFDDVAYEHVDLDAVRQVFRIASSIDSMVMGEPQILGQLKDAYRDAVEWRACGPILSRLFQRAFSAAKRVKNETRVAQRPVSVARVAVELARQIFERLEDKRALLVGAGEMIELALASLQREGLADIHVANRTPAHARDLADRFGASAHGLEELDTLLPRADVVLTCIGSREPLLTRGRMQTALRSRRNRPVFVIDIGVPRNVEPEVNELDGAFLYDLDDLQSVASSNAAERRRDGERAERIVLEEQQRFAGWLAALQAVPAIKHLRARAEAIRQAEHERFLERLGLDERQRDGVEQLTRALVNKLLHAPVARLRAETEEAEALAAREAARTLFALDDPEAPGAEADEALLDARARELGALDEADDEDTADAGEGGVRAGERGGPR